MDRGLIKFKKVWEIGIEAALELSAIAGFSYSWCTVYVTKLDNYMREPVYRTRVYASLSLLLYNRRVRNLKENFFGICDDDPTPMSFQAHSSLV